MDFVCWKCGADVRDEPMPLGRETRCRVCQSDLHVCRQCGFYDTTKGKSCAEPVADEVRDKERANFCGYFVIDANAHTAGDAAAAARQQLESLFGVSGADAAAGKASDTAALQERRQRDADDARDRLSKLFGLDDD